MCILVRNSSESSFIKTRSAPIRVVAHIVRHDLIRSGLQPYSVFKQVGWKGEIIAEFKNQLPLKCYRFFDGIPIERMAKKTDLMDPRFDWV